VLFPSPAAANSIGGDTGGQWHGWIATRCKSALRSSLPWNADEKKGSFVPLGLRHGPRHALLQGMETSPQSIPSRHRPIHTTGPNAAHQTKCPPITPQRHGTRWGLKRLPAAAGGESMILLVPIGGAFTSADLERRAMGPNCLRSLGASLQSDPGGLRRQGHGILNGLQFPYCKHTIKIPHPRGHRSCPQRHTIKAQQWMTATTNCPTCSIS